MDPKVGIRPTIDGRRKGIRESLEDQTMNMAKAAAELISRNLRYTDGTRFSALSPTPPSAESRKPPRAPTSSGSKTSESP